MPYSRVKLPVERLTDKQLWSSLQGRLALIEQESYGMKGRTAIRDAAGDAQAIIAELKQRGVQLSLPIPDGFFPPERQSHR